jgi:hypothetical protein
VHRFFRRDGHTWRRKKDGRTVREAHERLKVYFLFSQSFSSMVAVNFYLVNIKTHTVQSKHLVKTLEGCYSKIFNMTKSFIMPIASTILHLVAPIVNLLTSTSECAHI